MRDIAAVMQEFTQSGGVRPFGVSLLVAGIDDDGPQLYQVDPSGAYFGWRASAIGKNFSNAKTFLEKRYSEDMELEDAIHTGTYPPTGTRTHAMHTDCTGPQALALSRAPIQADTLTTPLFLPSFLSPVAALLTLRDGFEGEMTSTNVEIGIVDAKDKKFRVLSPAEVADYLAEAE